MNITQTFTEVDNQLNAFHDHKPFCIQTEIFRILNDDPAAPFKTMGSQIVLQMLASWPHRHETPTAYLVSLF
jgi:hypothetical protein